MHTPDDSHQLERIPTVVLDDPTLLAERVAARIAAIIRQRTAEGRHAVLGLATGSTPVGVYRALIRMHRDDGLSFRDVITFNLDEYYPMDPGSIHSYHRFMRENLFDHIDIDPARIHLPDGALSRDEVQALGERYEAMIREAGGIDFQILGIGKTGHIGFNEPGSGARSRTRLVTLDTITRRDAAADFFGEDNVPREAITMGVATILEAREIA
ncbi:MAG: glucosamine-6-phosphate isomerase, partial [Gemmatimonadetes bacterium]|nr:glucosamine-6-phosphate isomerase [Gemmatimonadota bacterium]